MAWNQRKIAARMSATLTLLTAAGLTAAGIYTLPAGHGMARPDPGLAAAAAAQPTDATTRAATAGQPGFQLIRSRSVAVTDVRAGDPASQSMSQAAGELKVAELRNGKVPPTTWDGKPRMSTTAPVSTPAAKPAAAVPPAAAPSSPPPAPTAPNAKSDPAAPAPAPGGTTPPAPPVVESWSDAEIATALKECVKLLGPVAAEIEPAEPTRKGPCGAPAPVKLKSIGLAEKIEMTPPIEVNCQMVVRLAEWSEKSLQPAAKEILGSRVVRLAGAGGYACRNQYGLAHAPLSEHALANAVDIPAFVLADGRTMKVAAEWGSTERDIAAAKLAAAAKAQAVAVATDKAAADGAQKPDSKVADGKQDKAADTAAKRDKDAAAKPEKYAKSGEKATEAAAAADVAAKADTGKGGKRKLAALKGVAIGKLGAGPTLASAQAVQATGPLKPTAGGRFLRRISEAACGTFGTVLGPEANDAHRDHFHFDLRPRRKQAFCQ